MKHRNHKAICIAAAVLTALSVPGAVPASAAEPKTALTRGDLNNDGVISVDDAQIVLSEYVRLLSGKRPTMTEAQINAADVNRDTVINVVDAQMILMYYCNTSLINVDKSWVSYLATHYADNTVKVPDTGDKFTVVGWGNLYTPYKMISEFIDRHPEFEGLIEYKSLGDIIDTGSEEQLDKYLKDGGDADLCFVTAGALSKFINDSKASQPLSSLGLTADALSDLYPAVLEEGKSISGQQVGISWYTEPGGYVYRQELAELYFGVKTPDEMQALVKDWDTFLATAKKLSELTKGSGKMVASFGDFEYIMPGLRRVPWLDAESMLQFGTEETGFADLLRTFRTNKYCSNAPKYTDEWYHNDWTDLFQFSEKTEKDHALGTFMTAWELSDEGKLGAMERYSEDEKRASYGKFRITQGPVGYIAPGSYHCFVPKNADNGSVIRTFLDEFIFDQDSASDFIRQEHLFSSNAKVNEKITADGYKNPLLGGQSQYAVLGKSAADADMRYAKTQLDYELNQGLWLLLDSYSTGTISHDGLLLQLDNACRDGNYPQIKNREKKDVE